jgi:hypothetical protein
VTRGNNSDGVDARDGLTRVERIILWQLREAQKELGRDSIPTALLYGRVLQHLDISEAEFTQTVQRLIGTFGRKR